MIELRDWVIKTKGTVWFAIAWPFSITTNSHHTNPQVTTRKSEQTKNRPFGRDKKKANRKNRPFGYLWLVVGRFLGIFWEIDKKVITLPYWKLLHRVSVPQGAELKGNQVRILNSTRCCKSHTKSDASAHTLPLVVSLLQRLHHIIREGVSTMGTSQKTCPHCKPTAAERHHCPNTAQSKVHVAFEP